MERLKYPGRVGLLVWKTAPIGGGTTAVGQFGLHKPTYLCDVAQCSKWLNRYVQDQIVLAGNGQRHINFFAANRWYGDGKVAVISASARWRAYAIHRNIQVERSGCRACNDCGCAGDGCQGLRNIAQNYPG